MRRAFSKMQGTEFYGRELKLVDVKIIKICNEKKDAPSGKSNRSSSRGVRSRSISSVSRSQSNEQIGRDMSQSPMKSQI